MSERKVLNKYYPADYDPSKIPKGKRNKNATFNIRIMAPFNMRCNMCKEYIYKGKKFNSRKEDVMDETYLGLKIFRFYIKCPRCVSEIAFKTDLENTDYTLEAGAKRLFEAEKIAQQMAEEERKAKEEDEMNPMTMLENRTKQSRAEMDQIDSLEELREMNSRKNQVNTDAMIEKYRKYEEMLAQLQMEKEEEEIRDIFGASATKVVKRLNDSDSDEEGPLKKKLATASTSSSKPTDILAEGSTTSSAPKQVESWRKSVGSLSNKQKLKGLVVKKKTPKSTLPAVPSMSAKIEANGTPENNTEVSKSDDVDKTVKVEVKNDDHSNNGATQCNNSNNVVNSSPTEKMDSINVKVDSTSTKVDSSSSERSSADGVSSTTTTATVTAAKPQASSGLGLLGAYADSESDDSDR